MNLVEYIPILFKGTIETLYMVTLAVLFSYLIGLPLGILVVVTDKKGILPHK